MWNDDLVAELEKLNAKRLTRRKPWYPLVGLRSPWLQLPLLPSLPIPLSFPHYSRIVQYAAGVVCGAVARCNVGVYLALRAFQDLNYYEERYHRIFSLDSDATLPTLRPRADVSVIPMSEICTYDY